jgi:hypothetical protein
MSAILCIMRTMRIFLLSLFAIGVSMIGACATTSSTVAVEGDDLDVSLLAGKWEGTYEGTSSGRKGEVKLDLAAGNRVAEGKVMMNSLGDPATARELAIKFMHVGGRKLTGTIAPYTDPQCNCMVETEFTGTKTGDTISGTFQTGREGQTKQPAGTWTATRKR